MIYVIADDLTGATDTGVQLSKQGYNTVVSIANLSEKFEMKKLQINGADVFVIDTETRESTSEKARERITNLFSGLQLTAEDIIYKKVDSTLRGNIGVEIGEIMKELKKDICIFTPSFPTNSRIVSGGYLLVQNEPLGVSEYYNGALNSGDASYIPYLLEQQTNLPVGRIDLKEVIKGEKCILNGLNELYKAGKKIIVIDAINDKHLKNIIISSSNFAGSVLLAGSAGLANYLSKICIKKKSPKTYRGVKNNSFVIVGGSRNNILDSQIEYLKKKMGVFEIKINVKKIFEEKEQSFKQYLKKAKEEVKNEKHIVIRPDPVFKKENVIERLKIDSNLSFRELEVIIRNFLGELTAMIIKECSINNVIITGGDTSIGVCRALGINNLKIHNEILPGIPLSTSRTNNHNVRLVTKAGGFGEADTLYKLINKLIDYD